MIKVNRVYIACPSNCFTGGPTLLHQLCHTLSQRGVNARMAYYIGEGTEPGYPVHPRYAKYKCDFVLLDHISDVSSNLLIVPETAAAKLDDYSEIRKAIWWLSVDNYVYGKLSLLEKVQKRLKSDLDVSCFIKKRKFLNRPEFNDKSIVHLAQSEYARLFLESMEVDSKAIHPLSDYIDESYFAFDLDSCSTRNDVIVYNPKKMGRLVRELQERSEFSDKLIPLQGMNQEQLIATMSSAKVYVDFGPHPGKDRLPREAALCGCCIVTGKRGSAANDADVPIPKEYKLDDDASIEELKALLESIFENFSIHAKGIEAYRAHIAMEKRQFEKDIDALQQSFLRGGAHGE